MIESHLTDDDREKPLHLLVLKTLAEFEGRVTLRDLYDKIRSKPRGVGSARIWMLEVEAVLRRYADILVSEIRHSEQRGDSVPYAFYHPKLNEVIMKC